jgi:protein-tyrosine-phosphatase
LAGDSAVGDADPLEERALSLQSFLCAPDIAVGRHGSGLLSANASGAQVCWLEVDSAGTWAVSQQRLPEPVVRYGGLLGLELADHMTRPVERELLSGLGLVLVMERGQKEASTAAFPDLTERVYLPAECVDGAPSDIPDPVGAPDPCEAIFGCMLDVVDRNFSRIVGLAERHGRSGG